MQLHFRAVTVQDAERIMHWRTKPEVSAYMYTDFEPDLQRQIEWVQSIQKNDSRLDWIIVVDDEEVGLVSIVGIDRVNHRADWAYYLASPNVRGKGIGRSVEMNVLSYVFEELKLHKLCCEVLVQNEIVIKIHEKYGSTVEGTRRNHVCKNGEYLDIVEMGILRPDWEKNVKGKFEYTHAHFEMPNRELAYV
jgi:UDP-4-amino-4,6-dideoxy-N-acetyl-beta-L-altrosamine N-acetyltransferase